MPATIATAVSLRRLLKYSMAPRIPKRRWKPLRGEMREKSGMIRSGTIRGAACATEATTPAHVRSAAVGQKNAKAAPATRAPSVKTSAPRSSRQPAGSSITPTRPERRACARPGMTKTSATSIAESEANIGASREKAICPRSMASWSRFSVGSSVLSSRSAGSLIQPSRRLFPRRGAEFDLVARRHAEDDLGDGLAGFRDVAGRSGRSGSEFAFDEPAPARRHRGQDGVAELGVGAAQRHDDDVDRGPVEEERPGALAELRQVVEAEQHRLERRGVLRPRLADRAHDVLGL